MLICNVNETETRLSQLINRVLSGEEVVIARSNQPLVKMIPFESDTSPRVPGFWSGQVKFDGDWKEVDAQIESMFVQATGADCEDH